MEVKGKRMLLLGGTSCAEDILKYAKHNDITLVATGKYPKTVLKDISSEAYDVDAVDDEGLVELIKDKNIDGVFVGCNEDVVPHALYAARKSGLPYYCNEEQWDMCANKQKFKQQCIKNGIPVAKVYTVAEAEQGKIEYPVAVKPADSCGSQGFSVCNSISELYKAVEKAVGFSRTKTVLIEEFIPYDAVIIHYTLINSRAVFSGMSDKKSATLGKNGSSVMAFQSFPSVNTKQYLDELDDKVAKMFLNSGMHDGAIWIEAFNNNGKFIFNEMGYRFGGSMTYHPIRYFYGFDQLELMMEYALNGKIDETVPKDYLIQKNVKNGKKYAILPLHLNPGTVLKISGEEEIKNMESIYAYVPLYSEGAVVQQTGTVNQVFAYFHILYDKETEIHETVKEILDKLHVTSDDNKEMLFCLMNFE